MPRCWQGRWGELTWRHGCGRSGRLWYTVWQTVEGRRRCDNAASRELSCRSVPIYLLRGRLAFCRTLYTVWPFPLSRRTPEVWRLSVPPLVCAARKHVFSQLRVSCSNWWCFMSAFRLVRCQGERRQKWQDCHKRIDCWLGCRLYIRGCICNRGKPQATCVGGSVPSCIPPTAGGRYDTWSTTVLQ